VTRHARCTRCEVPFIDDSMISTIDPTMCSDCQAFAHLNKVLNQRTGRSIVCDDVPEGPPPDEKKRQAMVVWWEDIKRDPRSGYVGGVRVHGSMFESMTEDE
jgi:hypothetical protein